MPPQHQDTGEFMKMSEKKEQRPTTAPEPLLTERGDEGRLGGCGGRGVGGE